MPGTQQRAEKPLLKPQQLERARADLAGEQTSAPEIRFAVDLHTAFDGQREFGVRDPESSTPA